MKNSSPILSVVLPAWNEEPFLGASLRSIANGFAGDDSVPHEVVVCDNNSTDRTGEVAREAGATVIFEPHNQISRARNAGAAVAQGDWLLFLDADTVLPPGAGRVISAVITKPKSGGLIGELVFEPRPGPWGRATLAFWNRVSRWFRSPAGSFFLIRAEAFRELGGFPESVYAGEELLLGARYRRWLKARGLERQQVAPSFRIRTSSRKLQQFSTLRLIGWFLMLLCFPLAVRSRRLCAFWYTRPDPRPGGADHGPLAGTTTDDKKPQKM